MHLNWGEGCASVGQRVPQRDKKEFPNNSCRSQFVTWTRAQTSIDPFQFALSHFERSLPSPLKLNSGVKRRKNPIFLPCTTVLPSLNFFLLSLVDDSAGVFTESYVRALTNSASSAGQKWPEEWEQNIGTLSISSQNQPRTYSLKISA